MQAAGWVLFLSAVLGHGALVMYVVNWIHGLAIPHGIQGHVKWVLLFLIPSGAGWLWWLTGFPVPELLTFAVVGPALTGYVGLCALLGLALPAFVLVRHLARRPAPALLSNHNHVVDVAAALGFRPEGRGKYRLLTRLPGNEVLLADLAEKTLALPRLPAALDGLTILHLSDFHFCGVPGKEYFQRVMELCRGWEPDLVAFTGDMVDSDWHHCWIVSVLGRLRWKTAAYAVFGNHDYWHDVTLVRRRLRRIGFRVLGNGWETLSIRGEQVAVIGNEYPWGRPAPDLTDCPTGVFRLCLSHTPDNIYWAKEHDIDLVLAGHVHGGQVRLPVIGSIHVPSRYGRRFDCGTFEEPPTVMHVSRGLGGQEPLRYRCKPEVTRLTLRRRAI